MSTGAVEHRVARGRLHPVHRGVYAVGRPEIDGLGRWMAAVLACGPGAFLSHRAAGEHWGLRIARAAGLPVPETQVQLNGHRVDFLWQELGLVVETDGLRYHRTAARQSADARRDQAHVAASLTVLRYSHSQIKSERARVEATLGRVAERLR